jgi:hypothetical protein
MNNESLFHGSVAKWLHMNNYQFFYELKLPNSNKRADFLAFSPTDEKLVIECKEHVDQSSEKVVNQLLGYVALLNDPEVIPCFAFPMHFLAPKPMLKLRDQHGIRFLYMNFEDPAPLKYLGYTRSVATVKLFFPGYI